MNNWYLIGAIIAGIGFFVTAITGSIQATADWQTIEQKHRKWLRVLAIVFLIISVALGCVTYNSMPSNTSSAPTGISSNTPSASTKTSSNTILARTGTPSFSTIVKNRIPKN